MISTGDRYTIILALLFSILLAELIIGLRLWTEHLAAGGY